MSPPGLARFAALATLSNAAFGLAAGAASPKIVIFVMLDDVGWHDTSVAGHSNATENLTPAIADLAGSGVILDRAYAHFMCAPSRCSFLTGRLPVHVQQGQAFPETDSSGIPRNMTAIGNKMTSAGYRSHFVGKWDAGMATPTHTPHGRGFNASSLVYYEHVNDYYTQRTNSGGTGCNWLDPTLTDLWDGQGPAASLNGTAYEETLFAERIQTILTEHDDSEPLFLVYAPHIVHYPLNVPEEWYDKYAFVTDDETACNSTVQHVWPGAPVSALSCRRQHAAMMGFLDAVIGNMTATVRARGWWNDTLWVFSSDNGAPLDLTEGAGSNDPLKGGKYSGWEGGIRVLSFASGGFLPPAVQGTRSSAVVHVADWYATFCGLAGVNATDDVAAAAGLPAIDSVDLWPLLSGANTSSPRWEIPVGAGELIQYPLKLLSGAQMYSGWPGGLYPNSTSPEHSPDLDQDCSAGCLYNVSADPGEHVDLSASLPAVKAAMQARIAELERGFFNNNDTLTPSCPAGTKTLSCGCWMARHHWGGFLGPFAELNASGWPSP